MESIYYVMCWLCHRTCRHCYEDRFRPYYGPAKEAVVAEAERNFPRIIEHFPDRMTYLDLADPNPDGSFREKPGSVILAGGEILLEPVRQRVLYPALKLLHEKYDRNGGVKVIVQTTGDLVTRSLVEELLENGVWMISVSGLDAYHEGLETEQSRKRLQDKLTEIFETCGLEYYDAVAEKARKPSLGGRYYHFFGANPGTWIGEIWPRGRALQNELSQATITTNFCNRWSGGLNFLQYRYSGSEVSVEPNGNVYPCCLKTWLPIGNLLEEPLEQILERLIGDPVYEAITMGHPERMGIAYGWSIEKFFEKSTIRLPSGKVYQNLCIGCDRFHQEVLSQKRPELVRLRTNPPGL